MTVQPTIEAINAGGPAVRLVVPGQQGIRGFSIFSGEDPPDPALGVNGDFYLLFPDLDFYGPKAFDDWGTPISLIGPQGERGFSVISGSTVPDGDDGQDGEFYIRTGTWDIYGPKTAGVWGSPTSLVGIQGPAGQSILSGAGVPDPGLGEDGQFYIRTGAWDIYGPKTASVWGSPTSLIGPPADTSAIEATANAAQAAADAAQIAANNAAPAGTVVFVARNTAPTGWLKANGAAISRTTYAALFTAIGTTFGAGDGSTTFNVPDLRGEFIRGWDDGRGIDTGRVFGSAQAQSIEAHSHNISGFSGSNNLTPGAHFYNTNQQNTNASTGAAGGTETRPRNIALLAVIKF